MRSTELATGKRRRVTLVEIASAAQVSKSTASLVLNSRPNVIPISESTKRRVLDAAAKLGYRPSAAAKALATGRSHTALIVSLDFWDEHLFLRLKGIEAHLVPLGYSTRICTLDAPVGLRAFSEILHSGQADGVLLSGATMPDTQPLVRSLCQQASAEGVPVVGMSNSFPPDCVQYVADIANRSGADEAVSHLIGHGHRRIAFLSVSGQAWAEERQRGYLEALERADIPVDPNLIVTGHLSQGWAYEATQQLADTEDFTAMFVVVDRLAIPALSALKAAGRRVPEDCALIGFDNDYTVMRFTDPPVTTVENPYYDTGKLAAAMLVDLIEDRPMDHVTLPVHLVIRRSCGCTDAPQT
jgi:LacI family transcriptional regulator